MHLFCTNFNGYFLICTASMAAKIGIEEYLIEKVIKVHYKLEDKILRWKLRQTKEHLLIGHAETLVRSTKISEGIKPRKSSPHFVLILPCPVLFCPVKHLWNPQTTSYTWPVLVCCGVTERFVLWDEMTESGGLIKKPTCFIVMSWIVQGWEITNKSIRTVAIFFD